MKKQYAAIFKKDTDLQVSERMEPQRAVRYGATLRHLGNDDIEVRWI